MIQFGTRIMVSKVYSTANQKVKTSVYEHEGGVQVPVQAATPNAVYKFGDRGQNLAFQTVNSRVVQYNRDNFLRSSSLVIQSYKKHMVFTVPFDDVQLNRFISLSPASTSSTFQPNESCIFSNFIVPGSTKHVAVTRGLNINTNRRWHVKIGKTHTSHLLFTGSL